MTHRPAHGDDLSAAFHELLDEIAAVEQKILGADPPLDEADVLDGCTG